MITPCIRMRTAGVLRSICRTGLPYVKKATSLTVPMFFLVVKLPSRMLARSVVNPGDRTLGGCETRRNVAIFARGDRSIPKS